ncbi:thiol reductant ABC exporter subunit CydD [Marinobacterium sp. D7]|uniref:thiol reductant ABC exporter subunit CydD n=1 Tax=Marinobacterium ramblicola TaxID=2849041 RepID=UPI001C2D8A4A|nr:thiol reductant ABC exporter subunit CydD [Marinobacterium ramblicola]
MTSRTEGRNRARWLKSCAAAQRHWVLLSVLAGLGGGLAMVLQAGQLAGVISGIVSGGEMSQYRSAFALLLLAILLRAALGYLREWSGVRASLGVRRRMRTELLAKLDRLGPGYCHSRQTGDLSTLLLEQVEALDGYFSRYLPQMWLSVTLPLLILLFILPLNWAVALIFLLTAPLVPLFMALVGMKAAAANRRNFQALANISAYFLDLVQGVATLKLFQRSRGEARVLGQVSEAFRLRTMEVLRLAFLSSAVLEFFASVSIALTAVYLGFSFLGELSFGAWQGPITLYQALFILLLAPEFYLPLRELGTHYHAKQEAMAASERLKALLDETEHAVKGGDLVLEPGPVEIEFRDLGLTYPGREQPVLKGLNLRLAAGERVAIRGPSGAGKSSLMNLLLGFYPLNKGELLVNRRPLAQLERDGWLQAIAWVSQQTTLFAGTLRDNLTLARADASDEELMQACVDAHVVEFLDRLPAGLDTEVGETGHGLSGGQIQRIALARAFLKDAPLLLLDEPTANLDAQSESLVLDALARLSQGRTVLILTHREAAQLNADRVLELVDGDLVAVESGRVS